MDPDDLRKAWQAQDLRAVGPSEEEAVEIVLRQNRKFNRQILWRDVRESVVAVGLGVFFIWGGHTLGLHLWPEYAAAACCIWIAAFLFADRRVQRDATPGASAREAMEQALRRVEHQIRLLKSVAWWYLLPCTLAVVFIVGDCLTFLELSKWREWYWPFAVVAVLELVLIPGVYWLNQYAVKTTLVPMKQELEKAIRELSDAE